MCINQLNTITDKNTMKIQFTCLSALYNFAHLLITPSDPLLKRNSTPALVKLWHC